MQLMDLCRCGDGFPHDRSDISDQSDLARLYLVLTFVLDDQITSGQLTLGINMHLE